MKELLAAYEALKIFRCYVQRVSLFFSTNNIGLPKGEVEDMICPRCNKSVTCFLTSSFSAQTTLHHVHSGGSPCRPCEASKPQLGKQI